MSEIATLIVNLKKAAWNRQSATIGGGEFGHKTLKEAAEQLEVVPDMAKAIELALIAMGKAGANHDLNHPQRKAWEACRAACNAAAVKAITDAGVA